MIRRYVAFELKRLREASGKSQQDAATRIDTSKSRVTHLESGRNMPKLLDIEALLELYGVPEMTEQFKELIVQARESGPVFDLDSTLNLLPGFDMYVGLEQGASRIFTYDAVVVKGILQCRRYAEATIRGHLGGADLADDRVRTLVDLRMRRQTAFERSEHPLEVMAVIGEGVLRQQVGGADVAAEQLEYLLTLAERENITIRVLPFSSGAHPAMQGPFTRLEFPIERDPGVVYLEDLSGGRYRDDTEDIDRYAQVGAHLLDVALPARKSLSVIDTIRREL
ncbi:helix-turn-helix transcriptional regulator [Saccharothrix violaceirubra]|uniref:DNA-binding XRE family transcriptional regulator n=1 Tax=Saccharothrix violaceirubra TaxID=413306 RepID=A0A7W7WTV4_9PSEU|nr:helix-turn-helix transcriptional regulator [Saccharothrix violaceirubra]MBB4963529.1 DNA-binding XRE family transcriptional regulator [Saccharothrix violaceirubra]